MEDAEPPNKRIKVEAKPEAEVSFVTRLCLLASP